MWFGIILTALIGIALYALSFAIYKGKLEYIHEYHWKNIKEEERQIYGRRIARGLRQMGTGILCSIIFQIRGEPLFAVAFQFYGIFIGFIILHRAQKEHNGGWFS